MIHSSGAPVMSRWEASLVVATPREEVAAISVGAPPAIRAGALQTGIVLRSLLLPARWEMAATHGN